MKVQLTREDMPLAKRSTCFPDVTLKTFYCHLVKLSYAATEVTFLEEDGSIKLLRGR